MRILRAVVVSLALLAFAIGIFLIVSTIPYQYSGNAEGADVWLKHQQDVAQIYAAEPILVTATDCDPFDVNVDGATFNSQYVQELASCQAGGFIAQFTVKETTFSLESGRFVHIHLSGSQVVWLQVSMSEMTVMVFIMMAVMMFVFSGIFFSLATSPY